MNTKTPISALQELMAVQKLPPPLYVEHPYENRFKCTVVANGVTGVGYGTTKKAAKHESARNCLDKLKTKEGIICTPKPEQLLKNYVGDLNEWASKKGLAYPSYDLMTVLTNGEFFISCSFGGKKTVGRGTNKKDAKQLAAKNMLKTLDNVVDLDKYRNLPNKSVFDAMDTSKAIEMFNSLSVSTTTRAALEIKPNPTVKIEIQDTIQELKEKLEKYQIQYVLEEFQKSPYLITAKIKETPLIFMACDEDKNEALKKVLAEVLQVVKEGLSLDSKILLP